MGFAEALFGAENPFAMWANQNRNALGSIGAGIASGTDIGSGLAKAAQYLPEGRKADDAYATQMKAEQERQQQIADAAALKDKYSQWFMEQGQPQIAQGIVDGIIEPGKAYWDFIQPQDGMAPTADIQNYEYGQKNPGFMDWQTQRGGASEVSLTPTWGTDNDPQSPTYGQPVLGQLNKAGQFVKTELPPGVQPMDPASLSGARAGATVDAKTAAAARAALPGAQQVKTVTEKAIAEVRANEKGMKEWFGQFGPRGAYIHPGTEMGNFIAATKQANSEAFMQARNMLKGGGQITDYEGRRGEDAFARMQAALDTGDQQAYLRAISDFEEAVADGYEKLLQAAAGEYSQGGPAMGGASDDVDAILKSLGI